VSRAVWAHLDDDAVDQLDALLIERARVDDQAVVLRVEAMNGKFRGDGGHKTES
jgi:hypothetical protein